MEEGLVTDLWGEVDSAISVTTTMVPTDLGDDRK